MARSTILTILLGVIAAAAVMVAAATLVVAVGGCSGAGSSTATVSGASVKALAATDVTGALMLKRWLTILYRGAGGSGVTAVVKPRLTGNYPVYFEDSGANTDGSSYHYVFYDLPGYPGNEDVTWPTDGSTRHIEWDASVAIGDPWDNHYQHFTETWRTSASDLDPTILEYTWRSLYTAEGSSHQTWGVVPDQPGTVHLPGGGTGSFSIERTKSNDILTARFSDGGGFTLTVPLRIGPDGLPYAPDFAQGATGAFIGPAGTAQFTLAGVNFTQQPDGSYGHWTTLTVTGPDGSNATFAIGSGFSGSGQIMDAGQQLLGSLVWDASANGTLRQAGMDASAVTPSQSARRFAIDRFIYSTAAMGAGATW